MARYLQDVAADDVADAGFPDESRWVVRTTRFEVHGWPVYDDVVTLTTWCSGTGAAWAERRTSLVASGARIEAVSVWVNLDPDTMRPAPLGPRFVATYLASTGGRRVRSRLVHPAPDAEAVERRWALRSTDYDLLGHVNNAVAWVVVEDELARIRSGHRVVAADVEYPSAVELADDVEVRSKVSIDHLRLWVMGPDGRPAISAVATFGASSVDQ